MPFNVKLAGSSRSRHGIFRAQTEDRVAVHHQCAACGLRARLRQHGRWGAIVRLIL